AAGAINGIVSIADAQSGALLRTFSHPSTAPITAIAFNPDGTLIATLSDRRVWLWDAATGSLLATSPQLPAFVFKLAWSTGGTQLAIAGGSGRVWVWRVTGRSAPAEPATFARCASPWRLRDARLERAPFDPAACNALPAIAP